MRFVAAVQVHLLPGTLDPQGQAVLRAVHGLGHEAVRDVAVGRSIRLVLDASDEAAARELVDRLCRELLSNPVLETYRFDIGREAEA